MTASVALPDFFGVQEIVGRGCHSVVVRAADYRTGHTVAVKLFRPARWLGVREANALRTRVADAMSALADLRHPYLARIFEVADYRDSLYVCREYVQGEPIGVAIPRQGALPLDDAGVVVRQLACGIDALNAHGESHGAVNGGNVILARKGARLTDAAFSRTAGAFAVGGVRCRFARSNDFRDDIAALAALTIEIVCGRGASHRPASDALPRSMRSLIGRALAGNHRRLHSATEFAEALFPKPTVEDCDTGPQINPVAGVMGAAVLLFMPSLYFGTTHSVEARPIPAPASVVAAAANPAPVDALRNIRAAVRLQGPAMLARPEIADLVNLREPQRAAIRAYLKEQRAAVENIVQATAAGRSVDSLAAMGDLRRESRSRILGLLDADQLARWTQLERRPDGTDASAL